MTATMIALIPSGEWREPDLLLNVNASGLAINLGFVDVTDAGAIDRTSLAIHCSSSLASAVGTSAARDSEAIGRDRLATLFVKAASELFESATPAVQTRMTDLIHDRGDERPTLYTETSEGDFAEFDVPDHWPHPLV